MAVEINDLSLEGLTGYTVFFENLFKTSLELKLFYSRVTLVTLDFIEEKFQCFFFVIQ